MVIFLSLKNSPISSNHQNFHQNWGSSEGGLVKDQTFSHFWHPSLCDKWQKSESEHSQQQKFVLPLTFSEYLCQLPIDLSTVTIRQWSTDWTPGLPKPLILRVLGVQTPRLPRLPISHILRVLGVLESRLPRLPIASTF